MRNTVIVDSIQCLLSAYKNELSKSSPNKDDLASFRYLLGQSIRQFQIPLSNRHISVASDIRWKELSTKKIDDFHYRDTVVCDNLKTTKPYLLFNGAHSNGVQTSLSKNSKFIFRQMFHEDHVIPVSMILEDLLQLQIINRHSIENSLNIMHLCIILKEEDRKIGRTRGRSLDYNKTIANVYIPNGIIIL